MSPVLVGGIHYVWSRRDNMVSSSVWLPSLLLDVMSVGWFNSLHVIVTWSHGIKFCLTPISLTRSLLLDLASVGCVIVTWSHGIEFSLTPVSLTGCLQCWLAEFITHVIVTWSHGIEFCLTPVSLTRCHQCWLVDFITHVIVMWSHGITFCLTPVSLLDVTSAGWLNYIYYVWSWCDHMVSSSVWLPSLY